ncbi:MAG TPA: hypothetical protein VEW46_23310 [Pyrinomonadaceae bacterium]|nr:hypothetical protein [Pyrinomonadaceae bacterium]
MKKWETGRQTIPQRVVRRRSVLSIALLIALSVVATPRVSAQVECLGACEAQLAACNQDPQFSASCQDTYEACVDACLGQYAGILG